MRHTPCGCRSAHLVEVQPNFRLPPVSTMRRASAMPHSVGSLPPRKRHSRLTIVRRGCKRSRLAGIHGEAMYTAPDCAARAVLRATGCQCAGSRGGAPCVLLGVQGGDILSRERISPLSAAPHGVGKSRSLFGLLLLRAMRGKREDFSFEKPSLFTYFLLCRSNYSASCIAFAAATAFACASAEHCS